MMCFAKKIICLLLIGIFCLCLPDDIAAQFPCAPQVINYLKSEYGAANQNWGIDQDRNGHLFIANNKGLLVQDGTWQLYELPGGDIIRAVACAPDGRIFTGAFGEFGYWQKQVMGGYTYRSLSDSIHNPRFFKEEIWHIVVKGADVYFQSFSTIYLYRKGKISTIPSPGNIMYLFDIQGHLYIQVIGKGIFELVGQTFHLLSDNEIFRKDEAISILGYGSHELLVATAHKGLYILSKSGIVHVFASPLHERFKADQINAAVQLSDTSYAIGTIQKGVFIIHKGGSELAHFEQQNGLQNNTVLALKKDQVGNLWVALDRGLDQIVLHSPFRYYQDIRGDLGSVYASVVYEHCLYLGTNHGLFYYDKEKAIFRSVSGIRGQVWGLSVLGGQLFCAHNSGTSIINKTDIYPIQTVGGSWALKVWRSNPDFALQGTYVGLAVYKKDNTGHFHFLHILKGTEGVPYSDWEEDDKGILWLMHAYKGILSVRVDNKLDKALSVHNITSADGIDMTFKQYIRFFNGALYAISLQGVFQWNSRMQKFEKSETLWEKWGNSVFAKKIFPMPYSTFWIVKDDNQLEFRDHGKGVYSYSFKDFSLVGGYETILQVDSLRSFLCGENGFAIFDRSLLSGTESFKPEIDRIFLLSGGKYHPISFNARYDNDAWIVSYADRNIKVVAGLPLYDRIVMYRFRLRKNGEDAEWTEWQNATSRLFSNIAPGQYKLEVQSNINEQIASINLIVLPPWYWTWWAQIFYVLFLLFIAFCIIKYVGFRHEKAIARNNKEMEEKMVLQQMQHEKELLLLQQEKLEMEVQVKSEDIANSAAELIKRKKLLNKLHVEIEKQKESAERESLSPVMRKLSRELERQLKLEKDESKLFEQGFNKVHENFFARLLQSYPQLTPQDLKLAAYLRMNLGSKEIAPLLSITVRSIELKRYRLRKKIHLPEEENLNEFMMKF